MPSIYLAGPGIFAPTARTDGERQKALCRQYGFEGIYPLDQPLPEGQTPAALAQAIYRANLATMAGAEAIIADLTPFRGPSADPGTVFELAWMLARGRPAFAYSTDPRPLRDRVPGARHEPSTQRWAAPDGTDIEDFGLPENLMVACALHDAGASLITPPPSLADPALWCLEQGLLAAQKARFQ